MGNYDAAKDEQSFQSFSSFECAIRIETWQHLQERRSRHIVESQAF